MFPGDPNKAMGAVREILSYLGEDLQREGLKATPQRVVKSWARLFGGYNKKPEDVLTFFQDDNVIPVNQIVLLKNIEFYSTCEHHLLPFVGKAHVAYIPKDRVVGVSKLARLVEIYSRRLQVQERIGNQVSDALMQHLGPLGAACIIEAKHFCMTSRGVEKQNSEMVTSALRGEFLNRLETREELLGLIRN